MKEYSEYGYCHNCKLLKNKYLLASCNYNTIHNMGTFEPMQYTINSTKIYNIDLNNEYLINYLIEKEISK